MRNKEIDILKNTFERKYASFESTNQELENQLDNKERELLEERLKREELENELRRYKEDYEDMTLKNSVEAKYGVKDSMISNDNVRERSIERTDDTYCYDSRSFNKEPEINGYYDKLSSDLYNLRSEINNLKSDRANIQSSRNQNSSHHNSNGSFNNHRNENLDRYLVEKTNTFHRKPLSKKAIESEQIMDNIKISNYDSNFSEMNKLNKLEQQLNGKDAFEDNDSESEMFSYHPPDIDVSSQADSTAYVANENLSPNEETYKQQLSHRSKNNILLKLVNHMDKSGESNKNKLVPNLNMEKVHLQ